eukprot:CAMPEP_0118964404 /NCGR_PEP_ID=MMETSP1173-20130426/2109_1 /TAXON_ID=1034831 /ORGANISM="Rhizochromulina marina cf, Strain CCMP1243" /LENGTH=31 /DNA_ID= /DNA_START= /DNA_END= /DNA_ORIENTATION=
MAISITGIGSLLALSSGTDRASNARLTLYGA